MRELVSIHIGQAGVQLGSACWELFCLEHNVTPNGSIKLHQTSSKNSNGMGANVLFSESYTGKYVPRSIMIDLEPSVIEHVTTSSISQGLFNPKNNIIGKEDASNNFARGHLTVGRSYLDSSLDVIRKVSESCDSLQGFLIFHSVGGGTGSGLGSLLLEHMSTDFGKKHKVAFSVFPSPQISTSVVEPYNAGLSMKSLIQFTDTTIILDNEAIYDIASKGLKIEKPSYRNLNSLVAQLASCMTSSLRFDGNLNMDLSELSVNLNPYPRIHFLSSAYSPIHSIMTSSYINNSTDDLTQQLFTNDCTMVKADLSKGQYIACSVQYRGDVTHSEAVKALEKIKNKQTVQFVDWAPNGFKVSLNNQSPSILDYSGLSHCHRSACMLSNNTSISEVFGRINKKYRVMYNKRAFFHHYSNNGMEQSEFDDALEELGGLEKDYEEIVKPNESIESNHLDSIVEEY